MLSCVCMRKLFLPSLLHYALFLLLGISFQRMTESEKGKYLILDVVGSKVFATSNKFCSLISFNVYLLLGISNSADSNILFQTFGCVTKCSFMLLVSELRNQFFLYFFFAAISLSWSKQHAGEESRTSRLLLTSTNSPWH